MERNQPSFAKILVAVFLLLFAQSCYVFCLFKADKAIEEEANSLIEILEHNLSDTTIEEEEDLKLEVPSQNRTMNS